MPDCLLPPRRPKPADLPAPDPAAQATSDRLLRLIRSEISQAGGSILFDRFMELALYAPGLGYYVAGSRKFGEAGDFITAPEVSPLFAQCLARQASDVLERVTGGDILEFGAGSGVLAADLLQELARLGTLPARYQIMEVSPELRDRQREHLARRVPDLLPRVRWLERLPASFSGLVLANELLDAMPVSRFRIGADGVEESFVTLDAAGLREVFATPISPGLIEAVQGIETRLGPLAPGYISEINLRLAPWVKMLAQVMHKGAVLLIDYGYPLSEYYHPQRHSGTLMCHYRHRAHMDPFRWVGLQDITSHVDFSTLAKAACLAGFELAGYTTQAHFLLACGLDDLVSASDPGDLTRHLQLVQGVKHLTLPSEMGERFKVLGLVKDSQSELAGFKLQNLQNRL
jgi:SAM-dependent MidA family methyltransferase